LNKIYAINGPVVKVRKTNDFFMLEKVLVGDNKLIGEVISVSDEFTTIQVYEQTSGLKVGDPVFPTGTPLSVALGPGIISNIFDGIERPLKAMTSQSGIYINRWENILLMFSKKTSTICQPQT